MSDDFSIPFGFSYDYGVDNTNPYHIIDGGWGGEGTQIWFTKVDSNNPENVFELTSTRQDTEDLYITRYKWRRVWDNKAKVWRNLTQGENGINFPYEDSIIEKNRVYKPLDLSQFGWKKEDMKTISDIIDKAPPISELFKNK